MSEGELAVPRLDREQATALTERIRTSLEDLIGLLAQAYKGHAWETLGYVSWDAYCRAEFNVDRLRIPAAERETAFRALAEIGMTQREIASATGMSQATISRALAPAVSKVLGREVDSDESAALLEEMPFVLTICSDSKKVARAITREHLGENAFADARRWRERQRERTGVGVTWDNIVDYIEARSDTVTLAELRLFRQAVDVYSWSRLLAQLLGARWYETHGVDADPEWLDKFKTVVGSAKILDAYVERLRRGDPPVSDQEFIAWRDEIES